MTVKGVFIIMFFIAVANGFFSYFRIKGFLSGTKMIADRHDLEKFKDMARTQMKMALAQIGIQSIMLITGLYGLIMGSISLLLILLLNGIIIVLSLFFKKGEKLAQSLKTDSMELEKEYRDICTSWMNKPLADF